MENPTLFSPKTPHFFQPLLPGFQSHLKIPIKFFSEHIEGKHEDKTVNLTSDSSERTWEVTMEGHRLTEGWKEFLEAHDLRVGDIVVFRHEGGMLFHVTALGPSCCEIQYAPSRGHEEDEEGDEIERSLRSEKEAEKNLITKSNQSSSDLNCFSQSVTASNLSRDSVRVPMEFARRNGLNNKGRQEIVLMNEERKSWASELKTYSCCVFIVRGWTSFCTENKLEVGDSCTFRLLLNTETPAFRLCGRTETKEKKKIPSMEDFRLCNRTKVERKKQIQSEEDNIVDNTGKKQFLKLTPSPNSLELGKQHLSVSFTRVNKLNKPGEIILVDKDKVEWPMKLKADQRSRVMYIYGGKVWKSFCAANEVGVGDSMTLEFIQGGAIPLLKFCSKMEQPPFEAEAQATKRARVQKSKHDVRQKIAEEGGPSNKSTSDLGKLQHTHFYSISDHVAKVKESFVDTLTYIRRFQAELDIVERKLEDSLQEVNHLCMI